MGMKIALTRRTYITHIDGVNRFIALLAEGFAKLGHEPIIVSWCHKGVERNELSKWFKEIHGLNVDIPLHTLREGSCEGGSWPRIAWDWWTGGSRLLRRENVDTVIINGVIPLRFKPKIAVIHDIGLATTCYKALDSDKLWLLVAKRLYKGYDRVICVSSKTKDEVKKVLNIDCSVIPIPVKLDLFKPVRYGERENVIVHIGTRPVKNPLISIEAVRILRRKGYSIKLVVVGPSTRLPEIEGVEYRYSTPEREKLELLCRAKALILPSSYEGFSYATLEAMACGTPAVVSSAIPEEVVVDGFNGIRVNSYDPGDYASALEKLLLGEMLWVKLSGSSLEFVRQFNYIEVAKKYIDVIREVL